MDSADVDINRLLPLMNFLRAEKSPDTGGQTPRDALISLLALDYLKKVLNRNPVLENHPF